MNDDAQAVAGTYILQAAGGSTQAQVHRNGRLERRRPAPVQAGVEQYTGRIAETGDDRCLARTHLHQAGRGDGKGNQQRSQARSPPGEHRRPGRCVMVVMMMMTMTAMPMTGVTIVVAVIVMMMEQTQGTTPY
ncbi:hypothetical protein ALP29_200084 [Pseudomonas syringae pv. avii]|uniref:Uncharacterized protein n=1 Tax=Pseudomonas syringae pv. avii TaxID=663959 RepID=A0A3M5VJ85_PSESX|nr:hypothetical protein ALP29_200084 [Pseudomonas syringae pv. avii]